METHPILVMTSTVSRDECRRLDAFLKQAGLEVRGVDEAPDVDIEISHRGGASVLVIDAGLLAMRHDPQWRDLRTRRPALGIVVRMLISPEPGIEREGERSFLVHPDERDGLVAAIRTLAG